MISLANNVAALAGRHALERSTRAVNQSLERLATGTRINRASDDPAGSVAVTDFRVRERELHAKLDALAQQGAYFGAVEGAQSVVSDLLLDLRGVVVTAANRGALSDAERQGLQIQADSILQTIDHLANTTTFKGAQILTGQGSTSLGRGSFQIAGDNGQASTVNYSLADLATGGRLNVIDGDIEQAARAVEAAASGISATRAGIGAQSQAIQSQSRALQAELENVSAARSVIEDTDYARETAELVRHQVLQQAAAYATTLAQDQVRTLITALLA